MPPPSGLGTHPAVLCLLLATLQFLALHYDVDPTLLFLAHCGAAIVALPVVCPQVMAELSKQALFGCIPVSVALFWFATSRDGAARWIAFALPLTMYGMVRRRGGHPQWPLSCALVGLGAALHVAAVLPLGLLDPAGLRAGGALAAFAVAARYVMTTPLYGATSVPTLALAVYCTALPQVLLACLLEDGLIAGWLVRLQDPAALLLVLLSGALSVPAFLSCLAFHRRFDQGSFVTVLGCGAVGGFIAHEACSTQIPWTSLFGELFAAAGLAVRLHGSLLRPMDSLRTARHVRQRSDFPVDVDDEEMAGEEASAGEWPSVSAVALKVLGSLSGESAVPLQPLRLAEDGAGRGESPAPAAASAIAKGSPKKPLDAPVGGTPSPFGFVNRPLCCLAGYCMAVDGLVDDWQSPRTKEALFEVILQQGLSHAQRQRVWRTVAALDRTLEKHAGQYHQLLAQPAASQLQEGIDLDVARLFPDHTLFCDAGRLVNQDRVRRVLIAFAHRSPSIGYCQGMAYLVGTLLMQFPEEEECFWMFTTLMEKHGLGHLYEGADLRNATELCDVTASLLPAPLRSHLEQLGLSPGGSYMISWYLTLFSSTFQCWEFVMLVWDLMWMTAPEALLPLRVVLALHSHFAAEIMGCHDLASLVVLMHRTIPEQLAHSHVLRGAVSLQTLRKPLPPSNRLRDMYRGRGKPP